MNYGDILEYLGKDKIDVETIHIKNGIEEVESENSWKKQKLTGHRVITLEVFDESLIANYKDDTE